MKSLSFTFILFAGALSGLLYGCSADSTDFPGLQAPEANKIQALTAGEQKALGIANRFLNKKGGTRAGEVCDIQYVMSRAKTRSASGLLSDTLAYVINYADNGGFAIISNDNRVNPILGYSEKGNFSFSNEIAKENFIDRIEDYLADSGGDGVGEMDTTSHDITIPGRINYVEPFVEINLGQRSPWDSYVIQDYPGCPVGCVAVATATVMCYGADHLQYHGIEFPLKSMIKGIVGPPILPPAYNSGQSGVSKAFGTLNPYRDLSHTEAVDYMARLMRYIGADVGMTYTPDLSGAKSKNAYNLCASLNYNIPSGFDYYDPMQISMYLNAGYIIYLRGVNNANGGHAWVVDGCYTLVDTTNPQKPKNEVYLHCKWGWNGKADGYFSGDVFDLMGKVYDNSKYRPLNYFAVEKSGDER